MITEAIRHAAGVGPKRLAQLHERGIRSWDDALTQTDTLPKSVRDSLVTECQRCLSAREQRDIGYFVDRLHAQDKWRILAEYLPETSFFDIETDGMEYNSRITVIACWHRGELHTFVEHENLDAFLELLDDVTLLASFNGNSFDVPRVLDAFHIPALPCAHLDLRWPAFHHGLRGGLKQILNEIGVQRPADLNDTDGELAIYLWERWRHQQNAAAREHLIRYCASDVLALDVLAHHLVGLSDRVTTDIWRHLPTATASAEVNRLSKSARAFRPNEFGFASPSRLRARR